MSAGSVGGGLIRGPVGASVGGVVGVPGVGRGAGAAVAGPGAVVAPAPVFPGSFMMPLAIATALAHIKNDRCDRIDNLLTLFRHLSLQSDKLPFYSQAYKYCHVEGVLLL